MAAFFGGVVVGVLFAVLIVSLFSAKATFKIDHSNPEKTIYSMDFDRFVDFDKKTFVIMTISHE